MGLKDLERFDRMSDRMESKQYGIYVRFSEVSAFVEHLEARHMVHDGGKKDKIIDGEKLKKELAPFWNEDFLVMSHDGFNETLDGCACPKGFSGGEMKIETKEKLEKIIAETRAEATNAIEGSLEDADNALFLIRNNMDGMTAILHEDEKMDTPPDKTTLNNGC